MLSSELHPQPFLNVEITKSGFVWWSPYQYRQDSIHYAPLWTLESVKIIECNDLLVSQRSQKSLG